MRTGAAQYCRLANGSTAAICRRKEINANLVRDAVSETNKFDELRLELGDVHPMSRLTTAEAVPASLTAIHS